VVGGQTTAVRGQGFPEHDLTYLDRHFTTHYQVYMDYLQLTLQHLVCYYIFQLLNCDVGVIKKHIQVLRTGVVYEDLHQTWVTLC